MNETSEALLRAILATLGRTAFSVEEIHSIVAPKGRGSKQIKAYNMADGSLAQGDIAKKVKVDRGNFSRMVSRWVEAGIMFRLADNTLLHLYPVPEKLP